MNYRACRIFYSFTRNNCRTLYMCRVAAAPVTVGRKLQYKAQFIIQAVDAPTIPCVGDTVGEAVGEVLRRVRNLKEQSMWKDRVEASIGSGGGRAMRHAMTVAGFWFFVASSALG